MRSLKKKIRNAEFISRLVVSASMRGLVHKGWSKKYLIQVLGQIPGIPAKFAQILGEKLGQTNNTAIQPEPIPTVEARKILAAQLPELECQIESMSEGGAASLGQVHRVCTKDKKDLAVKIQFPGIRENLMSQLSILLRLLELSPASKMDLNIFDYRQTLTENFRKETDYRIEAETQLKVEMTFLNHPSICIPHVYKDLSSDSILIQNFEASISLAEMKSLTLEVRSQIAQTLTEFLFRSWIQFGFIHSDLHFKNWGYQTNSKRVVFYDFGSIVELSESKRSSLGTLLRAVESKDATAIFSSMTQLGFDSIKLGQILPKLPQVGELLLAPLLCYEPFDFQSWNPTEKLHEILGGDKWWLRSAGPAWLLLAMRSFSAWANALSELEVSIIPRRILETFMPEISKMSLQVPTFSKNSEVPKSATLNIRISQEGDEVVSLEMPSGVVDRIEDLVSDNVRKLILESGYNLEAIKAKVRLSNYMPQQILSVDLEKRRYEVWLS